MEALECLADVAAAIRSPASLRKLPGFAHVKFDESSERHEDKFSLYNESSKSLGLFPSQNGRPLNPPPNPTEEARGALSTDASILQRQHKGSNQEFEHHVTDANKSADGEILPSILVGSLTSDAAGNEGGQTQTQPPAISTGNMKSSVHTGFTLNSYQSGLLTPSDRLLAQLLVFIAEQNLKTYYENLCSFFEAAWPRSDLDKAILWLCAQKLVECTGDPVELVLCPKAESGIDALRKALVADTLAREELLRNLENNNDVACDNNQNEPNYGGVQMMPQSDCEVAVRVSTRKAAKRTTAENTENARSNVKSKASESRKRKDGPSKASQITNKIRAGRLTAWIKRNRPKGLLTRALRARAQVLVFVAFNNTVGDMEIRKTYGNNPDISKAVRWLYAEGYLARSGGGKKSDPYRWTVLPKGLEHVPTLKQKLLADTLAREEMDQLLPEEFKSDMD